MAGDFVGLKKEMAEFIHNLLGKLAAKKLKTANARLTETSGDGGAQRRHELDLAAVSREAWDGSEFAPGFRPLFRATGLNFATLSKQNVGGDVVEGIPKYTLATCFSFPVDIPVLDPVVAGKSIYSGQRGFLDLLDTCFLARLAPAEREQDLRIVNALAELPSFDVFMVYEALDEAGADAGSRYLPMSQSDWKKARGIIAAEQGRMLAKALRGGAGGEDTLLAMLARFMGAGEKEAREILRAWTGLLYYRGVGPESSQRASLVIDRLANVESLTRESAPGLNWAGVAHNLSLMVQEVEFVATRYGDIEKRFAGKGRAPADELGDFLTVALNLYRLVGGNLACFSRVEDEFQSLLRDGDVDARASDIHRTLMRFSKFVDR